MKVKTPSKRVDSFYLLVEGSWIIYVGFNDAKFLLCITI